MCIKLSVYFMLETIMGRGNKICKTMKFELHDMFRKLYKIEIPGT